MTIQKQQVCKNCILPDGFLGVQLNEEELCNFCVDASHRNNNWWKVNITEQRRQAALNDWNSVVKRLQTTRGERKYDCIIGYSGGKDSTALLYHIINEYNLNPLAVTVDNGFVPDVAYENMHDTLNKIKVDHLIIDGAMGTFKKLYQWLFLNHNSNEVCLTKIVCDNCADLVHGLVVRAAMENDIDLILFGYSPDQIRRYFYEIPQHEIRFEWHPTFLNQEPFTNEDHAIYLTPQDFESKPIPRIILPYHVLPYQEDKIIKFVESENLVKKGNASTLKTSCHIIATALFHDINRYGGIPYALQYAELSRQDPTIRKKWLRTVRMLSPLIKDAKFNEEGVNIVFNQLGFTKGELLQRIQAQIEQDPNKESIMKNVNSI